MIFVPRTDRSIVGNWWWTVDRTMLAGVAILALIGTVLIFAASPAVGERVFGAEMHFVYKHLVLLLPASLLLVGVSMLAPLGVLRLGVGMYAGFGVLLLLTLFYAPEVKGATRWLPIFGVPLQPSEFVKPGVVILAGWLLSRWPGTGGLPAADGHGAAGAGRAGAAAGRRHDRGGGCRVRRPAVRGRTHLVLGPAAPGRGRGGRSGRPICGCRISPSG